MDTTEAKLILATELARYRTHSYDNLKRLLSEQDTFELTGESGTIYQLEFQAVWDDRKNGNLRILGCIDGGNISTSKPLSDDFILSPEGKFIGE